MTTAMSACPRAISFGHAPVRPNATFATVSQSVPAGLAIERAPVQPVRVFHPPRWQRRRR